MSDEPTNDNNQEEVVAEDVQPSEAPVTEQEVQPDQEEVQAEETPADEAPEEPTPSRREQLRVQDLLRKYGPPQRPEAPSQDVPNFREKIAADEEVYQTLEETAKQYGAQQYDAGQSKAELTTWRRFLQLDESTLRNKYEELNPSSEAYHSALEKTLQQKYLNFVGYIPGDGKAPDRVLNPDVSYLDFVEAEMEFANELATQKAQRTTQNIAKQAATTGLRPDGSTPKRMDLNKDPSEMSDEELEAAISRTMPRDDKGRFTKR